MAPNLPLSLRVGSRPPAIVIDGAFALSEMGLAVTMALSASTEVWLPRGLADMFDNDTACRRQPETMAGEWLTNATGRNALVAMAEQLEPWRRAWQNGRLTSRVHWIHATQFESAFPDHEQSCLLPRFEHCCAAFRFHRTHPSSRPLDDCARDVIALAGALQPERVYILTLAGADGPPPLCRWLPAERNHEAVRQWNGLPDWSDPVLGPGFSPLATLGSCAAIVQVIAPAILSLPDGWTDEVWDEASVDDGMIEDLWLGARMLWRPLVPMGVAA